MHQKTVLSNGLRVLSSTMPHTQSVSVDLFIGAGSRYEDDAHGGIVKLNPLADWDDAAVWDYIKANEVPYNRLYDMGYTSIGCAPCTRPVEPGEDSRAGRWWWESGVPKECGIHMSPTWARAIKNASEDADASAWDSQ